MSRFQSIPPLSLGESVLRIRGAAFELRRAKNLCYSTVTDNTTTTKDKVTGGNKDKMATDEDYMSFLDKANQDPNEGVAKSQSGGKVELKAVDEGVKVPEAISKVLGKGEAFYVSDADEPFVGVALKLGKGKGLPDEGMLCSLRHIPSLALYVGLRDVMLEELSWIGLG